MTLTRIPVSKPSNLLAHQTGLETVSWVFGWREWVLGHISTEAVTSSSGGWVLLGPSEGAVKSSSKWFVTVNVDGQLDCIWSQLRLATGQVCGVRW